MRRDQRKSLAGFKFAVMKRSNYPQKIVRFVKQFIYFCGVET